MLESEKVSVAAPFSFQGSAERIWRVGNAITNENFRIGYLVLAVVLLIPTAWTLVLSWYLCWGIWLVPYRMIRRSQRKNKVAELRHRELLGR